MTKNIVIGIDLGTTYSCVAVWKNNHAEVIANDLGNRTTPSYVGFTSNERLIGDTALMKAGNNYKNTVYDAKRLIGRKYEDPDVQSDMKYWPFKVIEKFEKPHIHVKYKNETINFTPEEISSMILTKLKECAQDYLGGEVTDVVITVPAYFNDAQRRATIDAGKIAGLNVLKIINEPTAAALAYGLNKTMKSDENVLIVDLGGGTYDVSLLSIKNRIFTVKATSGDTHLGGEDFTNRLVDYFVSDFKRMHNKDLSSNQKSLHRLRRACETAKRTLSTSTYASIEIDFLFEGIDFSSGITRSRFEELNSYLFEKMIEPISSVLNDANMSKSDINEIVLVGGSTRIPKIQELVSSYFDGKELKKTINPDEAVARGAAIQAAILSGDLSESIKNLSLQDVIPLSLGIDNRKTITDFIIKRNSPIPIKKTVTRITCHDNQSSVRFRVCQGERSLVKDNIILGELTIEGITKAPRGETKFDLTYEIDKNGVFNVSAVERGTGLSKAITISNNKGRLYQDEIDRLIKEAEKYKEDDEKAKERIESMNELDDYIYNLRKRLKNSIISLDDKITLSNAIDSIDIWMRDNQNASKEEYEQKKNDLMEKEDSFFLFLF
ncbi:hsp71-like protein [Piromyces finnis]|uniref:Hsp71-like protein n=1 Tax=Piromyces finnis TaxID=1754191 RepID=A0A1Y1VC89_9FUNG|nr:hsp71-like protein [Piromyces finnis]|eukprot:ORX51520.1 hsp71-like protein [Piromyces finnis]